MPKQGDYTSKELANVREFTALVVRLSGGQKEAAKALSVSQAMIASVVGGSRGPGLKVLRAAAQNQGVSMEAILRGTALKQVEARLTGKTEALNSLNMERAGKTVSLRLVKR